MSDLRSYSEKLRDPRWQKKRLEVMNRDNWTCCMCGASNDTLNVHHLKYIGNPWEVDNDYLITLCEPCHANESNYRKNNEDMLLDVLRIKGFSHHFLFELSKAFHRAPPSSNKQMLQLEIIQAIQKLIRT